MSNYRKFLAAFVAAVASTIVATAQDGLTSAIVLNAVIAGVGAVYVLISDSDPAHKALAAGLSAGLVALSSVISDGVTGAEWYQIGFAVVTVLTSYFVPNQESRVGRQVR